MAFVTKTLGKGIFISKLNEQWQRKIWFLSICGHVNNMHTVTFMFYTEVRNEKQFLLLCIYTFFSNLKFSFIIENYYLKYYLNYWVYHSIFKNRNKKKKKAAPKIVLYHSLKKETVPFNFTPTPHPNFKTHHLIVLVMDISKMRFYISLP